MQALLLALALSSFDADGAKQGVQSLVARSGAEVSVAMQTLDGRAELLLEPDRVLHAASTMKVPVMIELFAEAKAGKLRLEDEVVVRNSFSSILDASPYSITLDEDAEAGIIEAVGGTLSLRRLCESMIETSSNLATNILLSRLGLENVQRTIHRLHADGMRVLRGVEDGKAFMAGLNNRTTARALLNLLRTLAEGRAVDRSSSREMVEILKKQRLNEAIPAGLPEGIAVAHKTGEITRIHHDAAIVYAKRPFVLVVLVRGIEDPAQSARLIADVTRVLYAATQQP